MLRPWTARRRNRNAPPAAFMWARDHNQELPVTVDTRHRPALILDRLTPVYDLFARLLLREGRVKRDLLDRARVAAGCRVLDLGAGTGTLAIMLKRAQPAAQVFGLDANAQVLAIARDKASRAGAKVALVLGDAAALPYLDESFDRVVSSLLFSLLSEEAKRGAAQEAYRVLRGGGELQIADFGPPHTRWGRLIEPRQRRFEPISLNLAGRLPALFRAAGFERVDEAARFATILGTISVLAGRKPG